MAEVVTVDFSAEKAKGCASLSDIDKETKMQIEELRADISDLAEKVELLMTVKEDIATLVLVWNNATGALWVAKKIGLAVIGVGAFLAGGHAITTFFKGPPGG